jgi:hypothetical protein
MHIVKDETGVYLAEFVATNVSGPEDHPVSTEELMAWYRASDAEMFRRVDPNIVFVEEELYREAIAKGVRFPPNYRPTRSFSMSLMADGRWFVDRN